MRQEGVLLALVEPVHLVDKDDGAPWHQSGARRLGVFHRFTDVLHPPENRTDGDELRIKRVRHQPRDGGLAGARRPPQDAAVRLAGLERQTQRHAFAKQMPLSHDFAQGARAQLLGQRRQALRSRTGAQCHGRITSAPAGGLN